MDPSVKAHRDKMRETIDGICNNAEINKIGSWRGQDEDVEMCDLQGWLVPTDKVPEFTPMWENNAIDDEWDDEFCFAVWDDSRGLTINFINEF